MTLSPPSRGPPVSDKIADYLAQFAQARQQMAEQLNKVLVGQQDVIEQILAAVFTRLHDQRRLALRLQLIGGLGTAASACLLFSPSTATEPAFLPLLAAAEVHALRARLLTLEPRPRLVFLSSSARGPALEGDTVLTKPIDVERLFQIACESACGDVCPGPQGHRCWRAT